jgi:hypothetical protein
MRLAALALTAAVALWFDEGLDMVSSNCELENISHSEG